MMDSHEDKDIQNALNDLNSGTSDAHASHPHSEAEVVALSTGSHFHRTFFRIGLLGKTHPWLMSLFFIATAVSAQFACVYMAITMVLGLFAWAWHQESL